VPDLVGMLTVCKLSWYGDSAMVSEFGSSEGSALVIWLRVLCVLGWLDSGIAVVGSGRPPPKTAIRHKEDDSVRDEWAGE